MCISQKFKELHGVSGYFEEFQEVLGNNVCVSEIFIGSLHRLGPGSP